MSDRRRQQISLWLQPNPRECHFYPAMKITDYYRTRAWELRREAESSIDAKVKQSKLETAKAFERLRALSGVRRPRNTNAAQPAAAGTFASADTSAPAAKPTHTTNAIALTQADLTDGVRFRR